MTITLPQNFSIGNAAGVCKSLDLVDQMARSGLTEITLGSITVKQRSVNSPGTVHFQTESGASINALGMPNLGATTYADLLQQMVKIAHASGKLLAVSIAPLQTDDLQILLSLCVKARVDIIELNAGCPNVWDEGQQKRILSFDLKYLSHSLQTMLERKSVGGWSGELRVKLSPYSDPGLLAEVAKMIGSMGSKKYRITVVTCNTFPNALMFDDTKEISQKALTFGEGYGGYSGQGYLPIALGQVQQFRKHLSDQHRIIGVGGISSGRDVIEHVLTGANGVQIGAALYYANNPAKAADNILQEIAEFVEGN